MAKPTKKQVKKQRKAILLLVSVLVLTVLTAAGLSVPELKGIVFSALEIDAPHQPPAAIGNADFGAVSVHFIDVGQGDAVLLEADGEFALIDAGPPGGRDDLIGYLNGAGVTALRYVLMTHPHADHIGGMQAVLEQFPVALVLLPDFDKGPMPTTALFEDLLAAMLAQDTAAETVTAGGVYPLGGGSLTILQDGIDTSSNLNLLSVVTLFEADGLRFVSSGDAETPNEKQLLQDGADLSAQLFKAGHHGSSTSNFSLFVAAMKPQLVVVPCAESNIYGHPHREAMQTFEEQGATVLITGVNGHVRVGPDGAGGLVYGCSKQDTAQTAA